MSSSAKIFWMFGVFLYCSCLEMIDIMVYEYFLTPPIFPHVETFFVGHIILITHFLSVELGTYFYMCWKWSSSVAKTSEAIHMTS